MLELITGVFAGFMIADVCGIAGGCDVMSRYFGKAVGTLRSVDLWARSEMRSEVVPIQQMELSLRWLDCKWGPCA